MKLPDIAHDKLLHFFYGSLVSFPLILILGLWGFLISLFGFAIKEIICDRLMKRGKAELMDFVAGSIPAAFYYITRII